MKRYTFEHGILLVDTDGAVGKYIATDTKLVYGFQWENGTIDSFVDIALPLKATCCDGRNINVTYSTYGDAPGRPLPLTATTSRELMQMFEISFYGLLHWELQRGTRTYDALLDKLLTTLKASEDGRVGLTTLYNQFYEANQSEFYNEAV